MIMNIPRLVIGGTSSGVGKTTITAGIIAALKEQGLRVQPFKCGPDYIDPSYLTHAAGLPCRNLDSWMLSRESMVELFNHAAMDVDVAIIEGVMGLYDGRNGLEGVGSTAEIAKWLHTPVIMVIDVAKLSGSAAAIALGYCQLDSEVNLAGVILNNIGSTSHLQWVTDAVERKAGVPVYGYLPKNSGLSLPERHLGLIPAHENEKYIRHIEVIRKQVQSTIDVAAILDLANKAMPMPQIEESRLFSGRKVAERINIAVAKDKAFNFYYQDNLELLTEQGAEIKFISPLHDSALPPDIQGIYIGGGFPEVYVAELEENVRFKKAVFEAAESGIPVYAECGGLMYISQGIVDFDGNEHAMVGLVPGWAKMQTKRTRMGYTTAEVLHDNILTQKGQILRGHMFHWSKLTETPVRAAYRVLEPEEQLEGFIIGAESNILGSYLHLHFGSDPMLAERFVESCAWWAKRRESF